MVTDASCVPACTVRRWLSREGLWGCQLPGHEDWWVIWASDLLSPWVELRFLQCPVSLAARVWERVGRLGAAPRPTGTVSVPPDPQGQGPSGQPWGRPLPSLALYIPFLPHFLPESLCRACVSQGLDFSSDKTREVWIPLPEVSQTHDACLHSDQKLFSPGQGSVSCLVGTWHRWDPGVLGVAAQERVPHLAALLPPNYYLFP